MVRNCGSKAGRPGRFGGRDENGRGGEVKVGDAPMGGGADKEAMVESVSIRRAWTPSR